MINKKKYLLIVLLIVVVITLSFNGYSYAKYVYNNVQNYYLKSKGFYISSDFLDTNNVKNVNNLWDGGNVLFNLKNSLNDEVVTSYDIEYQVNCVINSDVDESVYCSLNDTGLSTINGVLSSFSSCVNEIDNTDVSSYTKEQCEINGYKWKYQVANKNLYFNIVSDNPDVDVNNVDVTIEVNTTSPYKKKISGNFVLKKNDNIINDLIIDYKNFSNYDRLSIYNGLEKNKCVRITFDSTRVLMDTSNNDFVKLETDAYANVNGFVINLDSYKSKDIIFYRSDFNTKYDSSIFNISNSDLCN